MNEHPYIKYAIALLMHENHLSDVSEITSKMVSDELEKGLNCFRVKPDESFEYKESIQYRFVREEKGNVPNGVFLAPNVISTDMYAKSIWSEAHALIEELKIAPEKNGDIKMSVFPIAGEFLSFSTKGSIGRGKPKATTMVQALGAITTLTANKPCLQANGLNTCIIPDFSIEEIRTFISFFTAMGRKKAKDLNRGNVVEKKSGKGESAKISFEPKRPLMYRGNFPFAPKSSALGSVALLGSIGEFTKEAEFDQDAFAVLESLKKATIYMIQYGKASSFSYNHHVIELAKAGKLSGIIDSLFYTKLYNEEWRTSSSTEYQKYDLFTNRFLLLFNPPAFRDFLAFRGEYQDGIKTLLNTYFMKVEKPKEIDPGIVQSAKAFGRWINYVAYLVAKLEGKNSKDELKKVKSKVLIELESAAFSAKTGDALMAQVITRAGRYSNTDVPNAATLFVEKTISGEITLDQAKNMLIAFSRLINKPEFTKESDEGADISISEDIQDDSDA